jgi:hypothetical protein
MHKWSNDHVVGSGGSVPLVGEEAIREGEYVEFGFGNV